MPFHRHVAIAVARNQEVVWPSPPVGPDPLTCGGGPGLPGRSGVDDPARQRTPEPSLGVPNPRASSPLRQREVAQGAEAAREGRRRCTCPTAVVAGAGRGQYPPAPAGGSPTPFRLTSAAPSAGLARPTDRRGGARRARGGIQRTGSTASHAANALGGSEHPHPRAGALLVRRNAWAARPRRGAAPAQERRGTGLARPQRGTTSERPVISAGWGIRISESNVGATSFSDPPGAIVAGRPTYTNGTTSSV